MLIQLLITILSSAAASTDTTRSPVFDGESSGQDSRPTALMDFILTSGRSLAQSWALANMKTLSRIDLLRSVAVSILVTGFLTWLVIRWFRWRRFVRQVDRIPGPPCHPFIPWIGHTFLVLYLDGYKFTYGTYVLIFQIVSSMRVTYYKERICKMWIGTRPVVCCFTPEAVEAILGSNVNIEKSIEYRFARPWLGEGLITSPRSKWRFRRRILTPAFHFRILEDFLPVMNEQAHVLVAKIQRMVADGGAPSGSIDVIQLMTLCTLDIICETTMGVQVGSQQNWDSDYVKSVQEASELILRRLMRPWMWPDWIYYRTAIGRRFDRSVKILRQFSMNVIQERKNEWVKHLAEIEDAPSEAPNSSKGVDQEPAPEVKSKSKPKRQNIYSEDLNNNSSSSDQADTYDLRGSAFFNGKKRMAFLDLLLQQHLVAKTLSIDDVREEVDTFMFAGHDTTSMCASWTLYLLGLHPSVQERVRQEVDSVLARKETPNGQIEFDDLKELKYLEQVLKESQRLYPSVPFIGRQLIEDVHINGYKVPKGVTCGVLTYLLHRDPQVWPNPEKFDPERFSPEQTAGRHPFAFVPFSAGPRNCIGQRFAQMELKIVLANVVRNFVLRSLEPQDKLMIVGELILRPRNGLKVEFIPRKFKDASLGADGAENSEPVAVKPPLVPPTRSI